MIADVQFYGWNAHALEIRNAMYSIPNTSLWVGKTPKILVIN